MQGFKALPLGEGLGGVAAIGIAEESPERASGKSERKSEDLERKARAKGIAIKIKSPRHAELVSASHLLSGRRITDLRNEMLKQVQHDAGNKRMN